MTVKQVSEAELLAQVGRCMFGERVVIEREGKRFSARIQHVGATGVKVVPETTLLEHDGAPGDINGVTVAYADIQEVEVDGITYRLA
ncbi:hypothetical protein [Billgrantia desiderata]|uniref:Uncharacterized protein n=1 Tax=Billgrantia desiderata TaxID=52021 RepID=A0AAW4Z0F4_9GAMM|nr:hypothetical protein [Halomonas desiderata]MCE8027927.1 hypothetical protein [Halomonas desiderata]MCE8053567.1 hypothetical protein [Halomonas desiderata]NIC37329.1 hypothetical protein [Halomonas desiderata]SEG03107.1 hypothetical protein SAMN04487953_11179 [Halomonas desiderata]